MANRGNYPALGSTHLGALRGSWAAARGGYLVMGARVGEAEGVAGAGVEEVAGPEVDWGWLTW